MSSPLKLPEGRNPVQGDTFKLSCRARYPDGVIPNLGSAKFWLTFKTDLSKADNDQGVIQFDSVTNPGYFTITNLAKAEYTIQVPSTNIVASTSYFCDVKIKLANGDYIRHLYDTVVFDPPVTKAT